MLLFIRCILAATCLLANYAAASIVMTGSRIIYNANENGRTIQLKNPDAHPYIVQTLIDNGINKQEAPFILSPPIFRMEPHSGHSVRLIYSGDPLPEDRESVFYFSFTQLPATGKGQSDTNKLVLAITQRVKVFYRPTGLSGQAENIAERLAFTLRGGVIEVSNRGDFHASVRHATLWINGKEVVLADSVMIAPKSTAEWQPTSRVTTLKGARLRLVLVNDYGVDVVSEHSL